MPLMQVLITIIVFAAVFLCIWSMFRHPVVIEPPVQRRIAEALGAPPRRSLFERRWLAPAWLPALAAARRFDVPGLRRRVRQDLDASGNAAGYSVDEQLAMCLVCGVAAGVVSWLIGVLVGAPSPVIPVLIGVMGLVAPMWSLRSASLARQRRINKKLPYTLDLISLMMGAGSTFTEAIETVVRDDPEDDFNQELKIVQHEIGFGANRATALEHLSERIPIEALRSMVGAINQAERLGTPLATILSTQAGMLRLYRSVRAEKLAASASLYILLPTMLVLIAAVLTLFGPMIVRWQTGAFRLY
ncbi:MAG: hypothetical protein CMJ18_27990 [Phycisphaeraceae bacterium]|nr:hypothetical protein [Phycisphaeraceae bacterium]